MDLGRPADRRGVNMVVVVFVCCNWCNDVVIALTCRSLSAGTAGVREVETVG